jgi:hypothetical protein
MNDNPLFLLTASIDEGVMYWLAFRASDELQVARHLLKHYWKHRRLFDDLRIDRENYERLTPDGLLKAIRSSHVDGDSRFGIRLHRVEDKNIVVVDE